MFISLIIGMTISMFPVCSFFHSNEEFTFQLSTVLLSRSSELQSNSDLVVAVCYLILTTPSPSAVQTHVIYHMCCWCVLYIFFSLLMIFSNPLLRVDHFLTPNIQVQLWFVTVVCLYVFHSIWVSLEVHVFITEIDNDKCTVEDC